LEKAAQTAAKAAKAGQEVLPQTKKLAQTYASLPNHVKALNKIDQAFSKFRTPVNDFLGKFYFNYQYGPAVRNIVSNNELILIDQGLKAWVQNGEFWTHSKNLDFLNASFSDLPSAAHGFNKFNVEPVLGGKLMEAGERSAAVRTVAASVRNTFRKMFSKIMPDMRTEIDAGVLTQRQVDKFVAILERNGGNLTKTKEDFRKLYGAGFVEDWRNLDFITPFEKNALQSQDYWDELHDLAQRGGTEADVDAVFKKLYDNIASRSSLVVNDPVGLHQGHPAEEVWGDLMKAVEDGHLSADQHEQFTAFLEAAEQARLQAKHALQDTALVAQNKLNAEGKLDEAKSIGAEINRINQTLDSGVPATVKEVRKVTESAWKITDRLRDTEYTSEDLARLWNEHGLPGVPPLDIDKKFFLSNLWDFTRNKSSDLYGQMFDAMTSESKLVREQLSKYVSTADLEGTVRRAEIATERAQAIRSAVFNKGLRVTTTDVKALAVEHGINSDKHLLSAINKYVSNGKKYDNLADVPFDVAQAALDARRTAKNLPPVTGIRIPAPHPIGGTPSLPRAWHENSAGTKHLLDQIRAEIKARWGQMDDARQFSPEMEKALEKITAHVQPKIADVKAIALKVAESQRNFTLLNYGQKTYRDVALSYIMPYHFFYTRSYKNWIRRIATNPEIIAGYGRYKAELERHNKDLPDWYKQQINVTDLLGIETDHPLFMNLEATFNPLYGLTGTDFNDPAKRVNWATATIDDMGKFGPTIWAPIQMAVAATLYSQGEDDAASRWGTRVIPQTAQIKALTSLLGKPIEFDPAVLFFSNGIDPYERARMGYAAAELIRTKQFTPEQIQADFQAQEGDAWDTAYDMAVSGRAISTLLGYIGGPGFKTRGESDAMTEQMFVDMNKLYAMSGNMSTDDFRNQWEALRQRYPPGFVDTVLLARKGGDKRDAAYAYSVLNRLPPGRSDNVLNAVGISQEEISKFYDSKGFTSDKVVYAAGEKERFMGTIVLLGAATKIPNDTTRTEWNNARQAYSEVNKNIEGFYGKDIWDKVSLWYDLKDDNPEAATAFENAHPEVRAALQARRESIVSDPTLSVYYGGIDAIESYASGNVRQKLTEMYGYEIYATQTAYYASENPTQFLQQHPELKRFWSDKRKLDDISEQTMLAMANALQEGTGATANELANPTDAQSRMLSQFGLSGQVPDYQQVTQGMPEWLQSEIYNYFAAGSDLTKRGQKELDYLAKQGGFYDGKDLMMSIGYALQAQSQTPTQPPVMGIR